MKKCGGQSGLSQTGDWGYFSPSVFGQTVNPISTRGADYAHHSTTSPPGFSDLGTALELNRMSSTFARRNKSNKLHLKAFQEQVGKFKANAENWILVFPRGNRSNQLHLKDCKEKVRCKD